MNLLILPSYAINVNSVLRFIEKMKDVVQE